MNSERKRPGEIQVRLQTASDPDKAILQLAELIRRKRVHRALIITEYLPDPPGHWSDAGQPAGDEIHVLGQNVEPDDIARLLLAAATALEKAPRPAMNAPVSPTVKDVPIHTIAHEWATLEAMIITVDMPPIQRSEMRRAFYAGATSLFHMMMRDFDPGSMTPTLADIARMEGWRDEIGRFGEELVASL